ncbi:MAG: DUF885 domain-containing protein [Lachnospiraceae bacterium]|nr:DUF885 domain-containing protein [Lachnospiraceae bacterium]
MKTPLFSTMPAFFHRKAMIGLSSLLLAALICMLVIFSPAPLTQNDRFDQYTDQIFRSEVCGNTISLHYTLSNPSSYGIEEYPITLGSLDAATYTASSATLENYLNALQNFNREELSPENQLTFDILTEYLKTEKEGADFYLYDEPLSPALGIQAQLPVLLAEYTFRTRQDIEDYLALLTRIPDYFQSIIHYEKEKSKAGLFMNDSCVNAVLEQCSAFLQSGSENCLRQTFKEEIDAFTNLTADEKISFKKQNEEILEAYVLPAYQNLVQELAKLLGSGTNKGGLCSFPKGKAYYTYLVHSETGDASSIEDIEARIKKEIISVYQDIQQLMNSSTGSAALEDTSGQPPAEILSGLQQKIGADFPAAPQVSCEVKYVPEALQNYLSPAFYLIPPIDDYANNVIYINPASNYNALELYTTLAHEGYPGHLYQTTTFEATNPSPLRSILNFGGYTEGWATYVEMYSYSTWNQNPGLAQLYQKDRSFMLGLASLLDIGIHYHGYSRSEVAGFLGRFGILEENSNALYDNILEAPANYLKYYVGYLNFLDLQTWMRQQLGDSFSLKEYHARVLNIGPCSFSVLKEYLMNGAYLRSIA